MSAILEGLNPEQGRAAAHVDGPLLVLAGAGSGKTRVLTHRIAHLLEQGVEPWQILAVTFTNKAAGEMKERVVELVGPRGQRIFVSTFHSACSRFLRQDIEALGYGRSFSIYDTDDQRRLMRQLMKEQGVDRKNWSPNKILSRIDSAKNRMVSPENMSRELRLPVGDPSPKLYQAYQAYLKAANAADFNDLINLVVKIWTEHPEILKRYQQRFRYLLVDEYQDTNRAQYQLIRLLGSGHGNVMVVGDDDQSIYGFRGADVRNILDFQKDFPQTSVVRLEQNYRSTAHILSAANAVVKNNSHRMEKELWTADEPGQKLGMIVGRDEPEEANKVLDRIRSLVRDGYRYGDMAIIYRTNSASRAFEQVLTRSRVPHVLVGARKFYERKEIKDLMAYLRLVVNPADDMAVLRAINEPRRGIGAKALESLREHATALGQPLLKSAETWAQGKGRGRKGAAEFVSIVSQLQEEALRLEPGELVSLAAEASGYAAMLRSDDTMESKQRLENLEELSRAISEDIGLQELEDQENLDALGRLQAFLDRAALTAQSDQLPDAGENGVITLLTAHLAKGLEFPVVFVSGMVEGGFPHFLARDREEDLEEERRLVYVAFTRAMKRLYLCRSRMRFVPGSGPMMVQPSRFLGEIPGELVEWAGAGGMRPQREDRSSRMSRLGFSERSSPARSSRPWAEQRGPAEVAEPPAVPAHTDGPLRTQIPESAGDLAVGARVLHPSFGLGTIQRRDGAPGNLKLRIQFDSHGRKTIFARYARLEIVLS
jgi:DNA helicase-2/ATP-dependent DNA helicase PcrA